MQQILERILTNKIKKLKDKKVKYTSILKSNMKMVILPKGADRDIQYDECLQITSGGKLKKINKHITDVDQIHPANIHQYTFLSMKLLEFQSNSRCLKKHLKNIDDVDRIHPTHKNDVDRIHPSHETTSIPSHKNDVKRIHPSMQHQ